MNEIKIDFSVFSQGEETAVLPIGLVKALVSNLPKVDDYRYKRNLANAIEKATTLEERAEVLKTAYMMTILQLEIKEPEEEVAAKAAEPIAVLKD